MRHKYQLQQHGPAKRSRTSAPSQMPSTARREPGLALSDRVVVLPTIDKAVPRPNSGIRVAILRSLRRGCKSELLRLCVLLLALGISVSILGTAYPALPAWLYDHTNGLLGQKITAQQQSVPVPNGGYSTAGSPKAADWGIPRPPPNK
jgi:hypothetical protein